MQLGDFALTQPFRNYRFNKMRKIVSTVTSVGSNYVTFANPSYASITAADENTGNLNVDNLNTDYAGKRLKVLLGPSTNSSNVGAMEIVDGEYASEASMTIYFGGSKLYLYNSGDPITFPSLSYPDGWLADVSGSDYSGGRIIVDSGMADRSGLSDCYCLAQTNLVEDSSNFISMDIGNILAGIYHRLEVKYYASGYFGSEYSRLYLAFSGWTSASVLELTNTSGWEIGVATFITSAVPAMGTLYISHGTSCTAGADIFLTGISLTWTPLSIAGKTKLSAFPIRGSVHITRRGRSKKLAFNAANNNRFGVDVFNDMLDLPITRYKLSYSIKGLNEADRENLFELLSYQNRGFLVAHWPGIAGIPYYLIGRLSANVTNRYNMSDFTYSDLSLTFEEVDL
jgi:hypothetical protein